MNSLEVESAREFVAHLDHGGDWRTQIEEFTDDEDVNSAFLFGLGAVQDAEIYFDDPEFERARDETIDLDLWPL